jgi:hypothetical protein
VYGDEPPEKDVQTLVRMFDKNKDGKISLEEWKIGIPMLKGTSFSECWFWPAVTTSMRCTLSL